MASKEEIANLLENVPHIEEQFQQKSTSDLKAILETFLSPTTGPLDDTSVISSVDAAIQELSA
jgi:hypothetical protein